MDLQPLNKTLMLEINIDSDMCQITPTPYAYSLHRCVFMDKIYSLHYFGNYSPKNIDVNLRVFFVIIPHTATKRNVDKGHSSTNHEWSS